MKVYLGDSVYVDVEQGMFKLTTENGMAPSNTIYMEPKVFQNFVEYAQRIRRAARAVSEPLAEGQTARQPSAAPEAQP